MKILLISDSHGHSDYINKLINSHSYNYVFFAGDGIRDLSVNVYDPTFVYVKGNCDFYSYDDPITQTLFLDGVKILVTHGNDFYVKRGLENLHFFSKQKQYNLVCFGHTHTKGMYEKEGITYINSGALKNGDYAEIEIKDEKINCEFKNVKELN